MCITKINDHDICRYTAVGNNTDGAVTICAMLVDWPSTNNNILLGALSSYHVSSVEMLGLSGMSLRYCTCVFRLDMYMCSYIHNLDCSIHKL